jgi:formylglycine-generating enzyme required for sulfatase activity
VTVNKKGVITSRSKGRARYYTEDINGIPLEMVDIPAGSFMMGSSESPGGTERPVHAVKVPQFYLGKYEVTQAQWRAVAKLPRVNRDLNPDPSVPPVKAPASVPEAPGDSAWQGGLPFRLNQD